MQNDTTAPTSAMTETQGASSTDVDVDDETVTSSVRLCVATSRVAALESALSDREADCAALRSELNALRTDSSRMAEIALQSERARVQQVINGFSTEVRRLSEEAAELRRENNSM